MLEKILKNSEIRFRGNYDRRVVNTQGLVNEENDTYVLFPDPHAAVLNEEFISSLRKPLQIIVPDGNWRQATKIVKRVPVINRLPRLTLPKGDPSNYRLRANPFPEGVCTFEAVARSLGALEGRSIQRKMEVLFDALVERVLWTRGKILWKDVKNQDISVG